MCKDYSEKIQTTLVEIASWCGQEMKSNDLEV